jgi:GDP-4-dehydro-6-deoxy-D-mannose reductase
VSDIVLVTGASGFAGGHLLEHLAGQATVAAWSRSAPPSSLASLARWQVVDVASREAVRTALGALRPKTIYHLAGFPHVAESWRDAAHPLLVNALGTHHLLDAVRREALATRVLIVSSAAVYAASDAALTEEGRLAPATPYGRSKLAQEQMGLRAWTDDGIEVVIVRAFNHIGPRQAPAFAASNFARQIALIERGAAEPIIRVGNLDARREFTDVRDVARAYVDIVQAGTPGTIYNVASGDVMTLASVLEKLLGRSRVAVRVETDPERLRPSDVPLVLGDAARLRHASGWQPRIPIERTLDDLLDDWRSRIAREP